MISQLSRFLTLIEIHPGAVLRRGVLHRSRRGRGDRRDHRGGQELHHLSGRQPCRNRQGDRASVTPLSATTCSSGPAPRSWARSTIGDNVRIGAGSVVIQDVPANSTVVGNPGRPVLSSGVKVGIPDIDYRHLPDPVAQAMQCLVHRIVQLENDLEEVCQPMQEKVRKSGPWWTRVAPSERPAEIEGSRREPGGPGSRSQRAAEAGGLPPRRAHCWCWPARARARRACSPTASPTCSSRGGRLPMRSWPSPSPTRRPPR